MLDVQWECTSQAPMNTGLQIVSAAIVASRLTGMAKLQEQIVTSVCNQSF